MLPLETKQSGIKQLHLSDLWGGGVFLGEASHKIYREMKLGTWNVMWTGLGWPRIGTVG